MDYQKLIKEKSWSNYPIGLGGCRVATFFDSCDFDLTIFDEAIKNEEIIQFQNNFIKIHHGSLNETNSSKLIQYDGMQILQDESWELRMFLAKITENRLKLYKDFAKNSLIESLFCCEKTKNGIKESNVFAPCWQKCASYFLAEGIIAINYHKSNPTNMLDSLRKLKKNFINEKIAVVNETVGIERSTPSLLERMVKSTIGFSDIVEKNNHSLIIKKKHDFFVKNSMLTDCYFYLGYINKQNFVNFKNSVEKQPDLFHILKIAFDIEADINLLEQQADKVKTSAMDILDAISG